LRDFDYQESITFLSRFFENTTATVEIRALPNERDAGPNRPLFSRDPGIIRAHCLKWDAADRAVYFGVATRRAGTAHGDREHVCELPALYTDTDAYKLGIDKDEIVARLLSLPIPPGLLIDSGGGIHGYWLLNEPIDVRQSEPDWAKTEAMIVSALRQLAGVVAGDNVADLPRIMRLPGTHNTKLGDLRPVTVLPCSTWARCEFADLVDMLDVQRPLITRPAALTNGHAAHPIEDNPYLAAARQFMLSAPIDIEHRLGAMAYLGNGEAGIHATQLSVSASLVATGADDDKIVETILAATHTAAGPLTANWNWEREEAAIRKMVESAKVKFTRPAPSSTVVQLRSGGAKPSPEEAEEEEDSAPDPGEYVQNDIGNAQMLIAQHGADLRYVLGRSWYVWDGKRYAADMENVQARRRAHSISAKLLEHASGLRFGKGKIRRLKWAVSSGNSGRISSMLEQAKPYIHSVADDLDSDPWLLNCQNGTLDLRDLELRPHQQSDLITSLCAVDYDPAATCPIWERFLLGIFNGDADLVEFLQRALGYSLTGRTDEQVVFILHGTGANGKSVLLETIAAILADYVKSAPSSTFAAKAEPGIPNDVAMLASARFVSVVETERNKELAEGLVKQATGGDRMLARFLHREWFEFTPRFKLWMATNHKPIIRGSDYAIWRRIRLLPFEVTFIDADKATEGQHVKDPDLKAKLATEFPGILAWMARGCAAWQTLGLRAPAAVEDATQGYRQSQDNIASFIAECCHLSRGIRCDQGLLFAAYEIWCEESDEEPATKRNFLNNLEERGHAPERSKRARTRRGIDLRDECRLTAELRLATARSKTG
jgi:P4 family phage/plasmid primase-like protien